MAKYPKRTFADKLGNRITQIGNQVIVTYPDGETRRERINTDGKGGLFASMTDFDQVMSMMGFARVNT